MSQTKPNVRPGEGVRVADLFPGVGLYVLDIFPGREHQDQVVATVRLRIGPLGEGIVLNDCWVGYDAGYGMEDVLRLCGSLKRNFRRRKGGPKFFQVVYFRERPDICDAVINYVMEKVEKDRDARRSARLTTQGHSS